MIECLKLNYYTENFVLWYLCSKNWPQIHVLLFKNWSFKIYLTLEVDKMEKRLRTVYLTPGGWQSL